MNPGILIEPIIDDETYGFAVQAKKFSIGLKITNLTSSPSEEFEITLISLSSASGQNISDDFGGKKFFVGIINPKESQILSIGSNGLFMHGLVDIKLSITPKNTSTQIIFLQKNSFTDEIATIGQNYWMDFFYIKSSSEYRQEVSTKWIIRLTWATVVLTILQVASILYYNN